MTRYSQYSQQEVDEKVFFGIVCTIAFSLIVIIAMAAGFVVYASSKGPNIPRSLHCDLDTQVVVYDQHPDRYSLDNFYEGHWQCVPLDNIVRN